MSTNKCYWGDPCNATHAGHWVLKTPADALSYPDLQNKIVRIIATTNPPAYACVRLTSTVEDQEDGKVPVEAYGTCTACQDDI